MMNAKKELLEKMKGIDAKIKCASITYKTQDHFYSVDDEIGDKVKDIVLRVNYTEDEYWTFLARLNFEYDDGYGSQELFGKVWLNDGTWLSRSEYDGLEWWTHECVPDIPIELL